MAKTLKYVRNSLLQHDCVATISIVEHAVLGTYAEPFPLHEASYVDDSAFPVLAAPDQIIDNLAVTASVCFRVFFLAWHGFKFRTWQIGDCDPVAWCGFVDLRTKTCCEECICHFGR